MHPYVCVQNVPFYQKLILLLTFMDDCKVLFQILIFLFDGIEFSMHLNKFSLHREVHFIELLNDGLVALVLIRDVDSLARLSLSYS